MLLPSHFHKPLLNPLPISSLSTPLPMGLLQVQQSQEKIARLEQEKEHWLLEAQLGKVRLEKENQRIADLEAQLVAALGGSPNSQAAVASALAVSHEETEKEPKAVGRETTLCTSLVSPSADCCTHSCFSCQTHFQPMTLLSDLLQQRSCCCSFLVVPTLSKCKLNKTQTSSLLMRQNRRILMFIQVGAEFTLHPQRKAVCPPYFCIHFFPPSGVRGWSVIL